MRCTGCPRPFIWSPAPPAGALYRPRRGPPLLFAGLQLLCLSGLRFGLARSTAAYVLLYAVHGVAFGLVTTVLLAH